MMLPMHIVELLFGVEFERGACYHVRWNWNIKFETSLTLFKLLLPFPERVWSNFILGRTWRDPSIKSECFHSLWFCFFLRFLGVLVAAVKRKLCWEFPTVMSDHVNKIPETSCLISKIAKIQLFKMPLAIQILQIRHPGRWSVQKRYNDRIWRTNSLLTANKCPLTAACHYTVAIRRNFS